MKKLSCPTLKNLKTQSDTQSDENSSRMVIRYTYNRK